MAQKWPLSQEANKATGVCSVCRASRQLHLKDGTVHKHGPRDRPCPGSHKPPYAIAKESNSLSQIACGGSSLHSDALDKLTHIVTAIDVPSYNWEPNACSTIKHIPKSARPSCAAHLSDILRRTAKHPELEDN